jgi:hypothetical protein
MRLIAATVLAFLLCACSGDNGEGPTPTTTASQEATATTVAVVPTLGAANAVPSVVWLVNAANGVVLKLYEDWDEPAFGVAFEDDEVVVGYRDTAGAVEERFDLSGVSLGRRHGSALGDCSEGPGGAVVSGRNFPGVSCGPISPDGMWMTYQKDAGEVEVDGGRRVPAWDQRAVNVATGEDILLQAGLRHCGGCDGRFGPGWSASGRFVYFSEWLHEGSMFLSDVDTGTTIEIFAGVTDILYQPTWSPVADLLLHPAQGGTVVLRDAASGLAMQLDDVAWPARFDSSGRYAYSPAWAEGPKARGSTSILDVTSGRTVATLEGQPPYVAALLQVRTIARTSTGFVAALENAPGCDGSVIYVDGLHRHCIAGAFAANLSPDGSNVALMRKVGETGPITFPGGGSVNSGRYEVVIIEAGTGDELLLVPGLVGDEYPQPAVWNDAGTHLLVTSPFSYGP